MDIEHRYDSDDKKHHISYHDILAKQLTALTRNLAIRQENALSLRESPKMSTVQPQDRIN